MQYRILIEQDEDGMFVVECPCLPGCVSQGKTRTEAIENIQDAILTYLEMEKEELRGAKVREIEVALA